MLTKPKNRTIAAALAFAGVVIPGLHKFYLRQPGWGMLYLVLGLSPVGTLNPIAKIASVVEGIWFLSQGQAAFDQNFNDVATLQAEAGQATPVNAAQVGAVADALRQLDGLRQDGLISEYEFEQKRRQLLDRMI
ncbi:SHOCT domain-containing protein [Leptolyngbya sp. AN02str]|uniref:SHOCT domain-containing protein n=1 Tax=Leptolyngbya sp. AN02str TaxID=3423363 RepID=UPI003D31F622